MDAPGIFQWGAALAQQDGLGFTPRPPSLHGSESAWSRHAILHHTSHEGARLLLRDLAIGQDSFVGVGVAVAALASAPFASAEIYCGQSMRGAAV